LKQLQADETDEYWIEVKPDPRKKWRIPVGFFFQLLLLWVDYIN
jgi:hypothetical protein